ncbi:hypothetical protein EDB92DRAFT_1948038 [Lactarius akahatsu]|uniref:Uncharacterized protein n=1 Tax=Lactarius akahatsu TaxID=416441 RepID=A0AAD4LE21_9AGAM|nr:hypothetical protein EDB92DRAFT_1948038 [Lactarius akahatsu]
MSDSVPPPPPPPGFTHIRASVLGPGIAGLFIQGIESGLIFTQFSRWLDARDRSESSLLSTIVIFVTVVGLAQSGISFASAWAKYVQRFGNFPCPDWGDYIHTIPTLVISVPVQALMIRRCYYLVGKNMFIITPLVLLLVASIVMSLWAIVLIVHFLTVVPAKNPLPSLQALGVSWPYLMSVVLPSVLDLILTGILLYYLTQTMTRVYAVHMRKKKLQFWMTVTHAMIGKLYVLSLFYMINAKQPLQPDERPTTFISTLTVPAEGTYTVTRSARGGDVAFSENPAECEQARTVDSAV